MGDGRNVPADGRESEGYGERGDGNRHRRGTFTAVHGDVQLRAVCTNGSVSPALLAFRTSIVVCLVAVALSVGRRGSYQVGSGQGCDYFIVHGRYRGADPGAHHLC